MRTGLFDGSVHIAFYRRKFSKISIDDLLCLTAWDGQALGKTKGGNAVNNAKIGCFGLSSHVCCYFLQGHFEDLGSRSGVNVTAHFEGLQHGLVLRKCGH